MSATGDAESTPKLPHFDTVLRGYNQRQVNERVTRLTYDLKNATKSRQEAQTQIAELSKTLGSVQQQLLENKATRRTGRWPTSRRGARSWKRPTARITTS